MLTGNLYVRPTSSEGPTHSPISSSVNRYRVAGPWRAVFFSRSRDAQLPVCRDLQIILPTRPAHSYPLWQSLLAVGSDLCYLPISEWELAAVRVVSEDRGLLYTTFMAVNAIWSPDIFQYRKKCPKHEISMFQKISHHFGPKNFFGHLSHWYQCDITITHAINTKSVYHMGDIALFWPKIFYCL